MKTCAKCKTKKPLDDFSNAKSSSDGKESRCRACRAEDYRAFRARDPEGFREKRRIQEQNRRERDPAQFNAQRRKYVLSWRYKKFYKLSAGDYQSLLSAQNGVCAICRQPETVRRRDGSLRPLHVDHSHTSGDVRGLLCSGCNSALGLLKENVSTLHSAISYLQLHSNGSFP
jgi:Autographiviridae endonuclease VII